MKRGVLILLPSSESKTWVDHGAPLDTTALSFPELADTREAVLDALVQVSADADGARRLGVTPTMADLVRHNVVLRAAPTGPAGSVYSGALYDALGIDEMDAASRRRARSWIVVVSALWGAVRLGDSIPNYRLNMCGRLPGLGHLPQVWQGPLAGVLPAAAGRGVVVDCRVAAYATAWRPMGELAERTVSLKVVRAGDRARGAGSYNSKRTQGLVVRQIVAEALDARRPDDLADALSARFDLDLRAPDRAGRPWELRVVEVPSS
jgi:cytoplasmic iron level regulating protein YaaA (DUF328/UPF0246 family)